MGDSTGISWTDATWNPTKGCEQISPGCANCYAKHQAARIVRMSKGKPSKYDGLVRITKRGEPAWTGEGLFDPEALALPLRWRAPRRIFVDSMSDLFFDAFTNEQIAAVFGVMAACPQHTFQVLTKRPARMREWFAWLGNTKRWIPRRCGDAAELAGAPVYVVGRDGRSPWNDSRSAWPLPNVCLGVSVENQDAADERIPDLLETPAAVRFLSCEPLLGPVDLHAIQIPDAECGLRFSALQHQHDDRFGSSDRVLDWVIAGCESGAGARPCASSWLRSLRDQCAAADVPFFLKQAAETADGLVTEGPDEPGGYPRVWCGEGSKRKPGGVIELPYLDGVQHAAFPSTSAAPSPSADLDRTQAK